MKQLIITYVAITFMVISSFSGSAQQVVGFSQYYMNPYLLNPASAGTDETRAFFQYRNQWVNLDGSPETYAFTLNGRLKGHPIGLGITILNDVTNFINRTNLGITSSYLLKVSEEHRISFGMTFLLIQNTIDFDKIIAQDFTDPNLISSVDRKPVFEINSGLRYSWKGKLSVGIVVDQMLQNRLIYEDANTFGSLSFSLIRHYAAIINYDFQINENFGVEPILIGRVAQGLASQYDASLYGKYKDILWLGTTYRNGIGWAYSFGFNAFDNLKVGYTYEMPSNDLSEIGGATHEITVGWNFGKSLFSSIDGIGRGVAEQKESDRLRKIRKENDEIDAKLDSIRNNSRLKYSELEAGLDSIKSINDFQQEEINALNVDFQEIGESLTNQSKGEPAAGEDNISGTSDLSSYDYVPNILKSKNILFSVGSHKVDPIYRRRLDELVQWLLINESTKIKLVGHSDASGNPIPALKLSEKRVESVKNYLIKRDVQEERISTEVKGSTQALSQEESSLSRKFNRRVEVVLDDE